MRRSNYSKKYMPLIFFLLLAGTFLCSSTISALEVNVSAQSQSPLLLAHSHFDNEPTLPDLRRIKPEQDKIELEVTEARLLCSDNDCSHHEDCSLEIQYRLSSVLRSNHDVGAQIMCRARLDYTTGHGYELQSERCSTSKTHRLHNSDRIDASIIVDFQFSSYEQVVEARVGSIQCNIEQAGIIDSQVSAFSAD